jgi:hypothetical protein
MRTHTQIIDDACGVTAVRKALADHGLELPDETVRSWPKRQDGQGSIPPEYWPSLVALGLATLDELAAAAEARKFPDLAAERRSGQSEAAA